jgi:hypothetical protein
MRGFKPLFAVGESQSCYRRLWRFLWKKAQFCPIREKFGAGGNTVRCTNCNRMGYMASKCMSKDRLPPVNSWGVLSFISCFKCRRVGHLARLSTQVEEGILRTEGSRREDKKTVTNYKLYQHRQTVNFWC